jgi:hypothetical protein
MGQRLATMLFAGMAVAVTVVPADASADVRVAYANAFLQRIDNGLLLAKTFPRERYLHLSGEPSSPHAAVIAALGEALGSDADRAADCVSKLNFEPPRECSAAVPGCLLVGERHLVERGALVELTVPFVASPVRFRSAFADASEVRTFVETTAYVDLERGGLRRQLLACLDERLPARVTEMVVPAVLYRTRTAAFSSMLRHLKVDFAPESHMPLDRAAASWSTHFEQRAASSEAWRIGDRPGPAPRSLRASLGPWLLAPVTVEELAGRTWDWRSTMPSTARDLLQIDLHRGGDRVAACALPPDEAAEEPRVMTCSGIEVREAEKAESWSFHATTRTGVTIEWPDVPIRIRPLQVRIDSCRAAPRTDGQGLRLSCTVGAARAGKRFSLAARDPRQAEGEKPLATTAGSTPFDRSPLDVTLSIAAPPPDLTEVRVTLALDDVAQHTLRVPVGRAR